jgi:hypothetical protein
MQKVITRTEVQTTCDVCGKCDDRYAYEEIKRVITKDGTVLHHADVCESCYDDGDFRYCEDCNTLVHDDFVIHDMMNDDMPYCPNCADQLIQELEDIRIRMALKRNEYLAKMKE